MWSAAATGGWSRDKQKGTGSRVLCRQRTMSLQVGLPGSIGVTDDASKDIWAQLILLENIWFCCLSETLGQEICFSPDPISLPSTPSYHFHSPFLLRFFLSPLFSKIPQHTIFFFWHPFFFCFYMLIFSCPQIFRSMSPEWLVPDLITVTLTVSATCRPPCAY